MTRRWWLFLCAGFGIFSSIAALAQEPEPGANPVAPFDGSLSVMTYNVKGAPWPVTHGRGRDLRAIGDRLQQLRTERRQPRVVILEEAFSADARAIARRGGYRFVVAGPEASERTPFAASAADARFLVGRRPWHGEMPGKWFGSGLLLLSDYPVTRIRRLAFPAFACAGFDCMANKGALLVTIEIPGAPVPVDIVATHLNSRRSAHVAETRSLYAYERQVTLLSSFIQANRDPSHPLIVAGDFNVGRSSTRGAALSSAVAGWGDNAPVIEALATVTGRGNEEARALGQDATAAIRRNTDFEFVAAGNLAELVPLDLSVPFGSEPSGHMLSDHIGYAITFRLAPTSVETAARSESRSPAPGLVQTP